MGGGHAAAQNLKRAQTDRSIWARTLGVKSKIVIARNAAANQSLNKLKSIVNRISLLQTKLFLAMKTL
ncbi:hypothetical protein AR685_01835 [Chryseobacterium sp. JAH]|nr:hypothetical protein AR685_01835 [Chryseobacterium sp. JAH]